MNQQQRLFSILFIFFSASFVFAKEPTSANEYNRFGSNHFRKKEYSKAISDYNKAIKLNPNFAEAYYNRGTTYYKIDDYRQSIPDFSRAIELDPRDATYYYSRGLAYFTLKEFSSAVSDLSEAIKLDPKNSRAYSNRGYAYEKLKNYRQAISDYSKAIELDPRYDWAYSLRGSSYFAVKDYSKAISDYSKAIEIDSNYTVAYCNRGLAYYKLEDYSKAISDYSKAIEVDSNYAKAYFNRGNAYVSLNDYPKAISDYSKATDFYPKDASLYYRLGLAYLEIKDFTRAKVGFEKAIQLKPEYAYAHENLGQVFLAMKKYKDAISAFDNAIKYDSKKAIAYKNRSLAYRKLGEFQKANADLAKAKQLDPSIPANRKVALLIGVNVYQKRGLAEQPLNFAERDVERTAAELEQHHFEVNILKGSATGKQKATRANIFEALTILLKDITADDIVLVGFAGHGMQLPLLDKDSKTMLDRFGKPIEDAYYCPVDAVKGKADTLISLTKLVDRLNQDGGINLVMVDACRDNPDPGRSARSISGNELNGRLPSNTAIIFSCSAGQQALETKDAGGGHGVFFYHVLEGLKGKAANRKGTVTWNGLATYVQENVNRKAREWFPERAKFSKNNYLQSPHELRNLRSVPVLVE